jgi:hypothetical protein
MRKVQVDDHVRCSASTRSRESRDKIRVNNLPCNLPTALLCDADVVHSYVRAKRIELVGLLFPLLLALIMLRNGS